MSMLVKVCGMTQGDNIREVEALGVDMMGFIFYPKSPRFASSRPNYLPSRAKRVGVFVGASIEEIEARAEDFGLDFIQLHGGESPEFCSKLKDKGFHLIKAFAVERAEDILKTAGFEGLCDYFLFDTKCSSAGGSGRQFDWTLLSGYDGQTPFLLSGGIGPETSLEGFSHPRMAGIDLNSRFETTPGQKDARKLKKFIEQL